MSEDNIYKPIRLTKGKIVDFRNMLKERPVGKVLRVQNTGPAQELAKLGIKGETKVTYRRDKDGNVIYDKQGKPVAVTQFTPKEVPAWFTRSIMVLSGHEPCYFEGCEEIVERYKAELKTMEERPGGCRECDKSRLKRKYSTLFRDALPPVEANKIALPTIPPHKITNLATKETISVPRQPVPHDQVRREVPESVKAVLTKKVGERKLIVNGEEISIDEFIGKHKPQPKLPGSPTGPGDEGDK